MRYKTAIILRSACRWSLLLLIFMVMNGCKKDRVSPAPDNSSQTPPPPPPVHDGKMTVLGKKLINPYSLDNVKKALANLGRPTNIQPTHLYVRFKPASVADFNKLYADTLLKLVDYPLDYEIVSRGEYYHDPTVPKNEYTWLYTVVPVDYVFPAVRYEVLDRVYLPGPEDMELEYELYRISGNLPADGGGREELLGFGTRPRGVIRVLDTRLNTAIGVRFIKVRAVHFMRIVDKPTDLNGAFEMTEHYVAGTDIFLVFDNSRCMIKPFHTNTVVGLPLIIPYLVSPAIYNVGFFKARRLDEISVTLNLENENSATAAIWATLNNSVFDFEQYSREYGLQGAPGKLTIYAHRGRHDGASSAPMLNYLTGWSMPVNTLSVVLSDLDFLLSNDILDAIIPRMPDVVYRYAINDPRISSEGIRHVFFHELGHVGHYTRTGRVYWAEYVHYITRNGGYGTREAVGSGQCALAESWAEHIGRRFTNHHYRTEVVDEETPREPDDPDRWIPYGIYHDLKDRFRDQESRDLVSGFNEAQCYSRLNARSPATFRNGFRDTHAPGNQQIDQLFRWYGY